MGIGCCVTWPGKCLAQEKHFSLSNKLLTNAGKFCYFFWSSAITTIAMTKLEGSVKISTTGLNKQLIPKFWATKI